MSNGQQWYMAIGGRQVGPVGEQEIINNIRNGSIDAKTLLFTAGMSNWTPLRDVPQFSAHLGGTPTTTSSPGPSPSTAPAYVPPSGNAGMARRAHEIDYKIFGEEMQFVEIELDPGRAPSPRPGR